MRERGSEEEDGVKGEKGSEEEDYFNKFPPTMPSVVLENRSIRMFKVSPLLSFSPSLLSSSYYLSPFFLSLLLLTTSPPSFLSIHFLTTYLPPSSPSSSSLPLSLSSSSPSFSSVTLCLLPVSSSSLPLSFLPLNPPPHYSPCFLSLIPIRGTEEKEGEEEERERGSEEEEGEEGGR
jgi:hypothetical protein